VRILARVQARERVAYRAQVVQTLKGKRVEELSFDLTSPMPKFPKDKFTFVQLPNCEMRGNLVADSLYVVYPAELSNPHAIVPVSTMDDVEIDRVEAWVHPKPKPE
jgi:diaminopimelate epimerase